MPEDPIGQEMSRLVNEKLQRVIDKQSEHTIALANHTAALDRLEKGQEQLKQEMSEMKKEMSEVLTMLHRLVDGA